MTVHNFHPKMHARSAYDAWKIARRVAEVYQRKMNHISKKRNAPRWHLCKVARDTADLIAQRIRNGKVRKAPPRRQK